MVKLIKILEESDHGDTNTLIKRKYQLIDDNNSTYIFSNDYYCDNVRELIIYDENQKTILDYHHDNKDAIYSYNNNLDDELHILLKKTFEFL